MDNRGFFDFPIFPQRSIEEVVADTLVVDTLVVDSYEAETDADIEEGFAADNARDTNEINYGILP